MNAAPLPFLDLRHAGPGADDAVQQAVERVLKRGWYLLGEELIAFEEELAEYLGAAHVVGVASGTDALTLALRGMGIAAGDEVITAANTCVPTVAAICALGATPVLADARPDTLGIDAASIAALITPQTRAIVPVHLYGVPCDMDAIVQLASEHGLLVVEDAAQALGTRWNGRPCGTLAHAAALSFYPTKNLGALGDAGAIVTNDSSLAEELRLLRSHGDTGGFHHARRATNSRMDEIQAAVLRAKLPHLESWNARRRALAARYTECLADSPLVGLEIPAAVHWNAHLYPIRVEHRDELRAHLTGLGIGTMIHYPRAIHHQPAYAELAVSSFPVAEDAATQILSLPLHPGLEDAEQTAVITALRNYWR